MRVLNVGNYREVLADVYSAIDALAINMAMGVRIVETPFGSTSCATSGSLTITMDDLDGSQSFSVGDRGTTTSNACQGENIGYLGTMVGSGTGTVTALSGTLSKTTRYAVSYSVVQDGFGLDQSGPRHFSNTEPVTLSVERIDAEHLSASVSGGPLTLTITANASDDTAARQIDLTEFVRSVAPEGSHLVPSLTGSFAITGAVFDAKTEALQVHIDRTLAPSGSSLWHRDGLITIFAADGSRAQLEFTMDSGGVAQAQTRSISTATTFPKQGRRLQPGIQAVVASASAPRRFFVDRLARGPQLALHQLGAADELDPYRLADAFAGEPSLQPMHSGHRLAVEANDAIAAAQLGRSGWAADDNLVDAHGAGCIDAMMPRDASRPRHLCAAIPIQTRRTRPCMSSSQTNTSPCPRLRRRAKARACARAARPRPHVRSSAPTTRAR